MSVAYYHYPNKKVTPQ